MNTQKMYKRLKKLAHSVAFLVLASVPSLVGAVDITVSGTADTADGPEACTGAAPVSCPSLRSAIRYANDTSPDPDTITLSAGTYTLSIDGVDETWTGSGTETDPYVAVITPDATIGDLDITGSLTITGAVDVDETLLTTIEWDVKKDVTSSAVDVNLGDRIFHVQALTGGTVSAVFSNLILTNGSVGVAPNTDCTVTDYPYDIEIVPAETCSIYQFRRFGGAVALGPGANIAYFVAEEHGLPGGDGAAPPDVGPGGDEPEEGGTISGVTFTRVAVISNAAGADGGGIYNAAPTTIAESVISGNYSGANGGGIYNDAEMLIDNTTIGTAASVPFIANAAMLAVPNQGENGGGLFDTGFHTTTITNSSINGNEAIGGGGIGGRSLIVFNITNTTISGNVASDVGGGITTNGTINLKNSTVVNNSASTDAPGGGAGLNSFGSGIYSLLNTIVADNDKNGVDSNCGCSGGSPTCPPGTMISIGHNLESADTCQLELVSDLINTDPLLIALANNGGLTETHALPHTANGDAADSPAVEAGDTDNCPNNDQRGGIRPADGNLDNTFECDIGAFELYIPRADLHFNNMTALDEVNKGDTLAVQAEVHNTAADAADNVVVTTTFPAALTSPTATYSIDGGAASDCVTAANVVTCTLGTLDLDSIAVIDLNATTTEAGDFTVSSEATTTTNDPFPENNTASVTTTVIGVSDMQVLAIADQSSVDIGDNVTITATLTNAGPDDATSVRIGTIVPDEVTLVSVIPSAGTCGAIDDDRGVACDIGNIANGGTATVTYVATVTGAGSIAWAFEASAYQTDTDADNNTAEAAFTGVANADLALTQTVSAGSLDEGATLAVNYNMVNNGPQAATGVTLVVTLPSGWSHFENIASQGTCTLAGSTLTCDIGDLAINGSASVTIRGTVNAVTTVTFSANAAAIENDPDTSNNSRSVSVKFEEEQNFFEELFGCTMGQGNVFDPTLLLIVIISLLHLARKELKASIAGK